MATRPLPVPVSVKVYTHTIGTHTLITVEPLYKDTPESRTPTDTYKKNATFTHEHSRARVVYPTSTAYY